MAYPTSIRERALDLLKDLLATMRRDQIPPSIASTEDPLRFDLLPENVVFGPLTEVQFRKNFAVGILEGDHTLVPQMQVTTNLLNVTLEIFLRIQNVQDGKPEWNAVLTDIHRLIRSDPTLGGLISNITITGDSVDVESWLDKKIDGAVFLQLNYKTAEDDPRQRVPGVIP